MNKIAKEIDNAFTLNYKKNTNVIQFLDNYNKKNLRSATMQ